MEEIKEVGYFEESHKRKSSIRLQMFVTLMFAFIIIGYQTYVNDNHTPDFLTMLVLLAAAFTPKVLSKFAEIKGVLPTK